MSGTYNHILIKLKLEKWGKWKTEMVKLNENLPWLGGIKIWVNLKMDESSNREEFPI